MSRPSDGGATPGYRPYTRTAVRYYPVVLNGTIIGFLWASETDYAASFLRRLEAQETLAGFQAAVVWSERFAEASARRMSPIEALRYWVGRSEHPEAGGIPAGTPEGEADSEQALDEIANPGNVRPEDYTRDVYSATWPDGTPYDRSQGWDPPGRWVPPQTGYSIETKSPIVYVPIRKDDEIIGYLWAATHDDAAYFVPRITTVEFRVVDAWISRLDQAKQEGLTPIQALRRWVGRDEEDDAGSIPADAEQREAPSLEMLERIARR
jgi:hypothetical protein